MAPPRLAFGIQYMFPRVKYNSIRRHRFWGDRSNDVFNVHSVFRAHTRTVCGFVWMSDMYDRNNICPILFDSFICTTWNRNQTNEFREETQIGGVKLWLTPEHLIIVRDKHDGEKGRMNGEIDFYLDKCVHVYFTRKPATGCGQNIGFPGFMPITD